MPMATVGYGEFARLGNPSDPAGDDHETTCVPAVTSPGKVGITVKRSGNWLATALLINLLLSIVIAGILHIHGVFLPIFAVAIYSRTDFLCS